MPFILFVIMIVSLFMCPPLAILAAAALWVVAFVRKPDTSPDHIDFVKDDGTVVQVKLGW